MSLKISSDITVTQSKLFTACIYYARLFINKRLKQEIPFENEFDMPIMEALDLLDIRSHDINHIADELYKLTSTSVFIRYNEIQNMDQNEGSKICKGFVLLDSFELSESRKNFKFSLGNVIFKNLIKQNSNFSKIHIAEYAKLRNKYAFPIYEYVIRYINVNIPAISENEFRMITFTTNKYKLFKSLKINVINPSVEEINSRTNLNLTFLVEKQRDEKVIIFKVNYKTKLHDKIENIDAIVDKPYMSTKLYQATVKLCSAYSQEINDTYKKICLATYEIETSSVMTFIEDMLQKKYKHFNITWLYERVYDNSKPKRYFNYDARKVKLTKDHLELLKSNAKIYDFAVSNFGILPFEELIKQLKLLWDENTELIENPAYIGSSNFTDTMPLDINSDSYKQFICMKFPLESFFC